MWRFYLAIGLIFMDIAMLSPVLAQGADCAAEVKKLQNSPEMRVQGGTRAQVNARQNAIIYLQVAAQAAAENDEKLCWQKLKEVQVLLFY